MSESIGKVWNDIMSTIETVWNTVGEPVMKWFGETINNLCSIANNLWITVIEPIAKNLVRS